MMIVADPCVAVVDDEAPVLKALGRLLRLADWGVVTFDSGESFLASLAAQRPDCVILDVHMPGLSGFDVLSRLRAADLELPVIFITASDDPDVADRAKEAGACTLLRKPFSNEALVDAVSAALRREPREAR
jgi:FixJ family two-component response regulator